MIADGHAGAMDYPISWIIDFVLARPKVIQIKAAENMGSVLAGMVPAAPGSGSDNILSEPGPVKDPAPGPGENVKKLRKMARSIPGVGLAR